MTWSEKSATFSNPCRGFHLVQENDMTSSKPDLVLVGPQKPVFTERLAPVFDVHPLIAAKDRDAFFAGIADRVRAIAVTYSSEKVNAEFMSRLPKLEIVSSFGVGYDHVDAKWAGAHGIIVTNTPDVLNEEVADTALGLLLCTVGERASGRRPPR
jgi:lactate dehydrogenase-like 2-hydroxyacid dehydrogenase